MARRVRRLFRGGRVVDLGGGHGLLAQVMLLLDDSSPVALVVDKALPPSAPNGRRTGAGWPRLRGASPCRGGARRPSRSGRPTSWCRVTLRRARPTSSFRPSRRPRARGRASLLPQSGRRDAGPLAGWLDAPMSIDPVRAIRLQQHGYLVRTQSIPADVTPKNRLLLGAPAA